MEGDSYRLHHDYTKLAWESGFCFETHKAKKTYDRNAIALIDIERIIRERDIAIVQKHVDSILNYNLDLDEIRILDPNFVKIFRLGQLSVEFLIYCKKYLDKTVVVLKNDLQKKTEENEIMKKEILKTQSENHKMKKRIKDLKSIHYIPKSNEKGALFQCHSCGKSFINTKFLNDHMKRRHNSLDTNLTDSDIPKYNLNSNSDQEQIKTETDRLQTAIKELKEKLNNSERYFNPENVENVEPDVSKNNTGFTNGLDDLRKQFDLLKNQVESVLKLIQNQKVDHNCVDIQEVLNKMVSTDKMAAKPTTTEKISSYTQTDIDIDQPDQMNHPNMQILVENRTNSPSKVSSSPQKRPSIQKIKNASHFIKIDTSATPENLPDIQVVQEEIEKKLKEKNEEDLLNLQEQLNEQMSASFNKLEKRMETFWQEMNEMQNKKFSEKSIKPSPEKSTSKQEESSEISDVNSPLTPEKPKIQNKKSKSEILTSKHFSRDLKTTSEESDSSSEPKSKQSSEQIEEQSEEMAPIDKKIKNVMEELKTKVEERKINTQIVNKPKEQIKVVAGPKQDPKIAKNDSVDGKKLSSKEAIQVPVVKKIFSQALKSESETEYTSEEESESSVETEKSEPKKVVKSITKQTNERLPKKQELKNTKSVDDIRKEITQDVSNRLSEFGINVDRKRLTNDEFKNKITEHKKSLTNNSAIIGIKRRILEDLEVKMKQITKSSAKEDVEIEQKSSKLKSIFSSMTNKAKNLMKLEKNSPRPAPVYRLTIHQNLPEEEKKIGRNEEIAKTAKNPVKRGKFIIKPKKMYESDGNESVNEKSDKNQIKYKNVVTISPRKSMSITSLDTNLSKKSIAKNMGSQSLSNLDSILELKKEIMAKINKPSSESESEISKNENLTPMLPKPNVLTKNYPSNVSLGKKKVLFDLESDEGLPTKQNKSNAKSNPVLHDDNDDLTSITSSVFEGSKNNLNELTRKKISTTAIINVPAKKIEGSDSSISYIS